MVIASQHRYTTKKRTGTFPCRRTICRTCPHITESTSIPAPGGHIKITGHFTCISENIIHCISCRKCPKAVYIGEKGRRLADRFREHRLDVLHNKGDLPVAQHFNGPSHSLEDMRVAVVKGGLEQRDLRQREEMRLIFKFRTLAPLGINRDFSFLWSRAHTSWHALTVCIICIRRQITNSTFNMPPWRRQHCRNVGEHKPNLIALQKTKTFCITWTRRYAVLTILSTSIRSCHVFANLLYLR